MNWISKTGCCRLRRQVVAVPAKWLEVGQVSRRRVVAVSAKCLGVGQVSRRRVVAVSAQWLGVGLVSRRRVVAVFGDGWLPSQVETKSGESYLDLRLVCAPVSWRLCPGVLCVWAALAFGLLFRFCVWVWSRRVLLALLRCLVSSTGFVSKRGDDPGHRPKDRVFRPWWSK